MKSILLIGQLNIAGHGLSNEATSICSENIFIPRNDGWQTMAEPIHSDRSVAGVEPAVSFVQAWCNANKNEQTGLIPCAEGSSSIDGWDKEGALFYHVVNEVKFAMGNSELITILWHQGESDSHSEKYKDYHQKLNVLVNSFRKELEALEVPFIAGGLGDYLDKSGFGRSCVEYDLINQELLKHAEHNRNCYFVTRKRLYPNPDGIHISAEFQRVLGIRYFRTYQTEPSAVEPLDNETNMVKELCEREYTMAKKRHITLE